MGIQSGAHLLIVIFRTLLIGVGALLLFFFLWFSYDNVVVLRTYDHAEAEVISSERIGPIASKGLNRFSVQVRFVLPEGQTKTASVQDVTTNFAVGEIIDVYYKPETDYTVIAGGFQQMWSHLTLVGFVALAFLFFGLGSTR